MNATYSPDDNKLRLYPETRLDDATYQRVKDAGFKWAPKQGLFFASWHPRAEDLLLELCGDVDDDDKSLTDRAEERAERFEGYSDNRKSDADAARKAVSAIADNIPLGQPILVGHHSERHARRDAERIENGMRKAVKMWETAEYWKRRAAGSIAHAKYKERPDVRARRIKTIETDLRSRNRSLAESTSDLRFWRGEWVNKETKQPMGEITYEQALMWANSNYYSRCYPLAKFPRNLPASQYEGEMGLWSALGGSDGPDHAIITVEQAKEYVINTATRAIAHYNRWIEHYNRRLEYERAMLESEGGLESDRVKPEKGGGCRCWASKAGMHSFIQKVNKVSVTVLDNWGNGGANFTRTIPFDKLRELVSKAQVDAARADGRLIETPDGRSFHILGEAPAPKPAREVVDATPPDIAAMQESLKAGVSVVAANQLFPTPPDVASEVIRLADIDPEHSVLEPSAGTGSLIVAADAACPLVGSLVAVEINDSLAEGLRSRFPDWRVVAGDFLEHNGDLGVFDRIVMNPPFERGSDIRHIEHALSFLKPGGRLVAVCANGPRQNESLKPKAAEWHDMPEGSFKAAHTNVNTAIAVFVK